MYEPAWLIPNSPLSILRAVFKGPNRSNRGTVSPIAQVARQKNEKGTDYWFLSYPSQTILREINTMKRNHVVILALLFALLPMLSACDADPLSENGEPEIAGEWSGLVDGYILTLGLTSTDETSVFGKLDVFGGYTFEPIDPGISNQSGRVTGSYDPPDVTLFFNGSAFRGHVNAEGTSLTLFDDDGERLRLRRGIRL